MERTVTLKTGELGTGGELDVLTTLGVGSCVVACLWDPTTRIGGMAHMLYPHQGLGPHNPIVCPGFSPDTALPHLLQLMELRGAARVRTHARLAGAGNMFEHVESGFVAGIGLAILQNTMRVLETLGVVVLAQSVGGSLGRSVSLRPASGKMEVTLTDGTRILL